VRSWGDSRSSLRSPASNAKPGVDANKLVFASDRWRPRGGKGNA
jgi:hypothetical protein